MPPSSSPSTARRSASPARSAPDQGEVEVYLDGKLIETVDLHGPGRLTQQPVFTSAKLKNEEHTIRLVKTSGDVVRIDAVSYVVG